MGTAYESWVFLMRLARNLRDFQMFNGEFQQSLKCCYTNFFKHSSSFRWVCISCHIFLQAFHHLGQHFMYRRAMFSGNKICDRSAKFLAEVRGEITSLGCFTSTNRRHETPNNSAAEALEFNFGLQFLGLGRCLATPLQPPNCCWRKQRRKVRFSFFKLSWWNCKKEHESRIAIWIHLVTFSFLLVMGDCVFPMNSEEILWPMWGCKVYVKSLESHASLTRQKPRETVDAVIGMGM